MYPCPLSCRAKHPVKVHVWAGISLKGATGICVFDGIMKKELYVDILDHTRGVTTISAIL